MAYLKITLGVGKYSDAGRSLFPGVHYPVDELKNKILERDKNTCRFCGFTSNRYQEVIFTGKGHKPKADPRKDIKAENYATACTFCHQCFHLDRVDYMQSGTLIWLPEIGQAALNHIVRAIYIARISRGPMADAAKTALETLLSRKKTAEEILGSSDVKVIASIMHDFLEAREYKDRMKKLDGFRIMPMDRRIITEGDLEFNQFPQMLAFWRSKQGPFGNIPVREWNELFSKVSEEQG